MPEKGYSRRTKIRDKGSFPKVPDCHGYNSYIGVDPLGLFWYRRSLVFQTFPRNRPLATGGGGSRLNFG